VSIRERIAIALERSRKSQRDLAKAMGLTSPTVSSMLSKDEIDSIKYLKAVEELTGFNFEWIRTGTGPEKPDTVVEEPQSAYWQTQFKSSRDELIDELRSRITEMKKYQELLEKKVSESATQATGLIEKLVDNSIDPARYIALQHDFLNYSREKLEAAAKSISYREYLEKDQLLTSIEKFIHSIEQELVQHKLKVKG
jgi:transcriptional regulator with XRE-family HTH domain